MQKLISMNRAKTLNFDHKRARGLDTLRIFALLLVTWQHAASVHGAYAVTQWNGISPGQIGVGIFCAISGYLAFYVKQKNAHDWASRRLLGIFPSYWLITLIAFAIYLTFGSEKNITIGLFISQMFGLGYFTHGWHLVNVVSWFISLIILCYALSYIAMRSRYPTFILLMVIALAIMAVSTRTEVDLSRHIFAFTLGALYGIHKAQISYTIFLIASLTFIGIGICYDPQLFYGGFSLLLLILSIEGWVWEASFVKRASEYSYEYFLVHGICLVAAARFIPNTLTSITIAVIVAMASAILLSSIDQRIQSMLKRSS